MLRLRYILLFILVSFIAFAFPLAAQIDDDDFEQEYDLAWDYYNLDHIESALNVFRDMQKRYPGNSRLYLTLGTIYLDLGDYESARDELRNVLLHDPTKEEAVWANVRLGHTLLKDGAVDAAERHYRAAIVDDVDPDALMETAYGLHRVKVQKFLTGRYFSGRYLVHWFPYGDVHEEDIEWLVSRLDDAYSLCNEILQVRTDVQVEVYLYPNEQSFVNLFHEGADTVYPVYGEIHEIIDRDYDYFEPICKVLLHQLQMEMNRHGSSGYIGDALPHMVRGNFGGIDLEAYVAALIEKEYFVDLKILRHQSFFPLVDKYIRGPQVASFLSFLRIEFPMVDIRQYITQPNLEALYKLDSITAQKRWLRWVEIEAAESEVSVEEIESLLYYVNKFDLVQIVPEAAEEAFKNGLQLINAGKEMEGEKLIKEALEIFPDFGLAKYALGRLEFKQDNFEKSKKYFSESIEYLTKGGTSWGWAHYMLGHIAEIEENYVVAIMHYERSLEGDVPLEVSIVAREKLEILAKIIEIAPVPGGEFERDDMRDAVDLFSVIDIALLNDRINDLEPYFATELNAASFNLFAADYHDMVSSYSTPITMHQVSAIETVGDFVKAKVIIKLEVPEAEQPSISEFEEYLKLRRGINRYFLMLRDDDGLKIVDFVDAPPLAGKARVLEEGGMIVPLEDE